MTLALAVPGLLEPPAPFADIRAYLPPTPALDRFRRAHRRDARHALAVACAGAATAAYAGDDAHAARWLRVDPVHLAPAADGLRLTAGPMLQLAMDDAETLAAHASRELELDVRAAAPHAWYAASDLAVTAPDPQGLGAESVREHLPADAALKRWLNDAQMALHEHPVNERRAAAGLPEINGLWPWGGAPLDTGAALPHTMYTNRIERLGLQRAVGRDVSALPDDLHAIEPLAGALVELTRLDDAARAGAVEDWLAALEAVEHDWLAPAVAALDARRVDRVTLVVGDIAYDLTRGAAWRFWQRGGFFDAAH